MLTGLSGDTPPRLSLWGPGRLYTSCTLSFSREVIMRMFDDTVRDTASIRLPRWGQVVPAEGAVPWLVVDPDNVPVEPIRRYLVDFIARDNRPGSVRSYAYALLRWWRWLHAVGVEWNQATPAEARDLVLWLKQAAKLRQSKRTTSAATAGTINPVTRKRHLNDQYTPNTIRHSNSMPVLDERVSSVQRFAPEHAKICPQKGRVLPAYSANALRGQAPQPRVTHGHPR
jgi:Phage integrase, N-terminal SAM-like domain